MQHLEVAINLCDSTIQHVQQDARTVTVLFPVLSTPQSTNLVSQPLAALSSVSPLQRQCQLAWYRWGGHTAGPRFLAQQLHKLHEWHAAAPGPHYRHPFYLLPIVRDHQRAIRRINLHGDLLADQCARDVVAAGTDTDTRILLH